MWALIKDNKIEEIIARPKDMVIDDVRHSRRIFTAWTWDELNTIGIYTVEAGTVGNDRFEYTSQPTYTYSASGKKVTTAYTTTDKTLTDTNDVDEDGKAVLDYKGNQTVTLGLKSIAKNQAKETANGLIKQFNWLVERSIYNSSKTIPSAVGTYVGKIKADCATIEAAIDGASDMAAFKKLYEWEYNEDGSVKTIAPIQNWSDDYDVKTYIR